MEDKKLSFKLKMLTYETFMTFVMTYYNDVYNEAVKYLSDNGINFEEVLKK